MSDGVKRLEFELGLEMSEDRLVVILVSPGRIEVTRRPRGSKLRLAGPNEPSENVPKSDMRKTTPSGMSQTITLALLM